MMNRMAELNSPQDPDAHLVAYAEAVILEIIWGTDKQVPVDTDLGGVITDCYNKRMYPSVAAIEIALQLWGINLKFSQEPSDYNPYEENHG